MGKGENFQEILCFLVNIFSFAIKTALFLLSTVPTFYNLSFIFLHLLYKEYRTLRHESPHPYVHIYKSFCIHVHVCFLFILAKGLSFLLRLTLSSVLCILSSSASLDALLCQSPSPFHFTFFVINM